MSGIIMDVNMQLSSSFLLGTLGAHSISFGGVNHPDITLSCGAYEFHAHRYVLERGLPLFATKASTDVVQMHRENPLAVNLFIRFMYTGIYNPMHQMDGNSLLLDAVVFTLAAKYGATDLMNAALDNFKSTSDLLALDNIDYTHSWVLAINYVYENLAHDRAARLPFFDAIVEYLHDNHDQSWFLGAFEDIAHSLMDDSDDLICLIF